MTVEGETFALARPFLVIATQNPIELDGTYPLPEAQLDRFLIRLDLGYPGEQEEIEILRRRRGSRSDAITLPQLLKAGELLAMQSVLEEIFVEPTIEHYIVASGACDPRRAAHCIGRVTASQPRTDEAEPRGGRTGRPLVRDP